MKTSIGLLSILMASMTVMAGTAQAKFQFDHVQGEAEYGRSKYITYHDSYLQACGSYETTNHSDMFGSKEKYDTLYPRIGQMHAELEQVAGMKSSSRRYMEATFKEAKKIIDLGYAMKDVHKGQMDAMGKNTALMGGDEYYQHAQKKIKDSHVDLDRSMKMKRSDAISSVTRRIKGDGERTREGEILFSSYDRWQQCKSFWDYEKKNWRQLR